MSRKFLGVSERQTRNWLGSCTNCDDCLTLVHPFATFDSAADWLILQAHIWEHHPDEEFCLDCRKWLDDTDMVEHLSSMHSKKWLDIKINE